MTLLSHTQPKDSEQRQELREARKLLKDQIRDDWDYPPLPAFQRSSPLRPDIAEADEERVAGFRFHTPRDIGDEGLGFEPTEWRERTYSSEPETDEDTQSIKSVDSPASKKSVYLFDGPDSVGNQVAHRRAVQRETRQRAVDDEASWNEGLTHWIRQRNAWTAARTSTQIRSFPQYHAHSEDDQASAGASTASTRNSSPRSSTSTSAFAESSSAAGTPDLAPLSPTQPPRSAPVPRSDVFVPVAPLILPNNPIRRRITPSMYNDIYTKIIVQSRTPSVPINLLTLITALVEGWKGEGEWPPKTTPLEPSLARKKKTAASAEGGLRSSVKAVGRVLRLTGVSDSGKQSAGKDGG